MKQTDNKTSPYQHLASSYDQLQQDIDYARWASYLANLDQRYAARQPRGDGHEGRPLLLDLGCGTGSICLQMEKQGYDVIGIDQSDAMLNLAREKAQSQSSKALFLQQDIRTFELYGTVDLAVCLLDTLNHLTRERDVERVFCLLANYLNPGSLFICDVGTEHHFAKTLGNKVFYQDSEQLSLHWINSYRTQSRLSRSSLTWFRRLERASDQPDYWERFDEEIVERYYDHDFLLAAARKAGLEFVKRTADLVDAPAHRTAERHFYLFRRRTDPL